MNQTNPDQTEKDLSHVPQDVLNVIATKEEENIITDLAHFVGIESWEDPRILKIADLVYEMIVFKVIDEKLNQTIKKHLEFLDEEKVTSLENYIRERYKNFIENLWAEAERKEKERLQKEAEEFEEKPTELSFEEREKRYLELIKEIYGIEPKKPKQEEKPVETEEKKVITLIPSEETSLEEKTESPPKEIVINWEKIEEKTEPELPEGTIIIKKKETEETEKREDLVDLSSL